MRKHTISFKNAAAGIVTAARTQTNIRIHLFAATVVLILSVLLHISVIEALILLIAIALVVAAEMGNTAIEFLSDAVTEENNDLIKHAKDVAAGGVLISAIMSMIVGLVIFVPKIIL